MDCEPKCQKVQWYDFCKKIYEKNSINLTLAKTYVKHKHNKHKNNENKNNLDFIKI